MTQNHAFTRREFVGSSLAVVSTIASAPTFLTQTAHAAAKAHNADDRVLVVVQLSGGNDGLNTVIPFGQSTYFDARPSLAIGEKEIITLDKAAGIGLHPQMADLAAMYDDGLLNIVQGAGYPNPNRSHFASMDIWHAGDTRNKGEGWIGRAMDQYKASRGALDGAPCIAIGKDAPLATNGAEIKPVTFENAALFRWAGADLHPALAKTYNQINRTEASPADDSPAAFVQRTSLDAQIASDRIRAAVARTAKTTWPNGQLANQLKMVASMVAAELPTRVYYVALGGFDTHANQQGVQARLLGEFAAAMRAFYAELRTTGQQSRVMTMAFSEFGRRVAQNASGGTDHGCAGPMFLFGDMVQPGLSGKYPSLTNLDQGDLIHTVDFRSVYAAVLDGWMKIDAKTVLGKPWHPAPILKA